jgi:phosphatidylserine/phosphatidylglycerophosphate/cardiolipin synthase-like enzyme
MGRSHRLGLFTDMEEYFVAAREAMKLAKRSIHALNWEFDPDTLFEPDAHGDGPPSDRFGPFLRDLALSQPELDIRILCWRSALPIAATQNFFPHRARKCFRHTPVKFRLDGSLPLGASHHQKALIVDDQIAFCGGGDIGPGRWDTTRHLDDDPRRQESPNQGKNFKSRHEVMGLVDGPAALALGDLFRERWKRATRESLSATQEPPRHAASTADNGDAWPADVPVVACEVTVGLSRTSARWRHYPEIGESGRLHLESIRTAKQLIYMENQYYTAPVIAEALAARLAERDGPEVVLISTLHSPSYFDRATMDHTREHFMQTLREADHSRRLSVFCPLTAKGRFIVVHAKLTIIDDELLRIGSANLNNRSAGLDTECDLVIQAAGSRDETAARRAIADYRLFLLAHWMHRSPKEVSATLQRTGRVGATVEALDRPGQRKLQPLKAKPVGPFYEFIARYHIGDPLGSDDNWRPWKRVG